MLGYECLFPKVLLLIQCKCTNQRGIGTVGTTTTVELHSSKILVKSQTA